MASRITDPAARPVNRIGVEASSFRCAPGLVPPLDPAQEYSRATQMTLSDDILQDAQAAAADEAVYRLMQDWVLDGGEETVMLAAMAQFVNDVNAQFRRMQN